MDDKTIINRLWWLRKMLDDFWGSKPYKEIYDKALPAEVVKEIDELVAYIKETY
jgi:CO dehydrogenase/acetyl-CoA synthase beta subunit